MEWRLEALAHALDQSGATWASIISYAAELQLRARYPLARVILAGGANVHLAYVVAHDQSCACLHCRQRAADRAIEAALEAAGLRAFDSVAPTRGCILISLRLVLADVPFAIAAPLCLGFGRVFWASSSEWEGELLEVSSLLDHVASLVEGAADAPRFLSGYFHGASRFSVQLVDTSTAVSLTPIEMVDAVVGDLVGLLQRFAAAGSVPGSAERVHPGRARQCWLKFLQDAIAEHIAIMKQASAFHRRRAFLTERFGRRFVATRRAQEAAKGQAPRDEDQLPQQRPDQSNLSLHPGRPRYGQAPRRPHKKTEADKEMARAGLLGEHACFGPAPTAAEQRQPGRFAGWPPLAGPLRERTNSRVYVPLLLAAAGLLDQQEAAGWSTHPLTHDWWQPTVEALQQADPVPAETFAQGLEFAGASPGAIYAVIAAGGGARPGHVHLPPVVRALADSAGYIDNLAQDLLLELFGGVVLARGVDRRADELRDPARLETGRSFWQKHSRARRAGRPSETRTGRAREARRGRAPDENEELRSRRERARELIRLGEVSAARQALTASAVAPGTQATLDELRDPARRLQQPREQLSERAARAPPQGLASLEPDRLLTNVRRSRRGAAPGPSGMTGEHLQTLLDDEHCCDLLHHAATLLARAEIPGPVAEALRLGRLTALRKSNGRVRGIVTGDVFRIPHVGDLQSSWLLLSMCANPRANFFLRALAPEDTAAFAAAHDDNLANALADLLELPQEAVAEGTSARQRCQLPLCMGGLGLRSASRTAPAAWWASWADCAQMLRERCPELTNQICAALSELDRGPLPAAPGCLQQASRAKEHLSAHGFAAPNWHDLAQGARPPPTHEREHGEWAHGWQFWAARVLENTARQQLLNASTPPDRALLRSQSGPCAGRAFTALPTTGDFHIPPAEFRVLLLRRLRFDLPFAASACRCRGRLDARGDHRAACPRAGVLKKRSIPLEKAAARICREAGGRVAENQLLRDLNVDGVDPRDGRKIEVIANGLPLWGGAQLAIDATLVSPVRTDGTAQPRAADEDGVQLAVARGRKEATYPELIGSRRCRLVVLGLEVGGRWSEEALTFVRLLARTRARSAPQRLRASARAAYLHRWTGLAAVAAQRAFAATLLELPPHALAVDGDEPHLADLLADARYTETP
ncbi:unnamed protein product, partial [Prorocentrum cordatum]